MSEFFDLASSATEQECITREHRRRREYESEQWGMDLSAMVIVFVTVVFLVLVLR